jgi:hypothetical protein
LMETFQNDPHTSGRKMRRQKFNCSFLMLR